MEGIQVEFNSITINETMGGPPRATLSFPADSKVLSILPKTICHIFWLDDGDIDNPAPSAVFAEGTLEGKYRLLFQGELSGTAMAFTGASREISLTFVGFTQNWFNYPVIPMDITPAIYLQKSLLCMKYPSAKNSGEPAAGAPIEYSNAIGATPITQFSSLLFDKNAAPGTQPNFAAALKKILISLWDNGLYLKKITKAFKILEQTHIYDSSSIASLVQIIASIDFIKNQLDSISGSAPVVEVLNKFLDLIGYDYCELAAPACIDGKISRIFIKPKMHFFKPILCNAIFDDDITDLRFQRNYDLEPTRMVSQNTPSFMSSVSQLESVLIATVVPNDVVIASAIKPDQINMLGLNQEELCRGIVLSTAPDLTSLEQAYYAGAVNQLFPDHSSLQELIKGKSGEEANTLLNEHLVATAKKLLAWPLPDELSEAANFQRYQMNMATLHFLDSRHSSRIATVSTPFNPYRLIGFPGVIITKYFTTLVGTIQQINTSISSDGSASQSLTFSHVRAINIKGQIPDVSGTSDKASYQPSAAYAFMDDDFQATPGWYKDFTGSQLDACYAAVTGYSKSSLNRYGATFNAAIINLKAQYEIHKQSLTTHKFITEITRRRIPSKTETFSSENWTAKTRSLNVKTPLGIQTENDFQASPWICERRKRVKEIFDVVSDTTPIVKDSACQ